MDIININTKNRFDIIDITSQVQSCITNADVKSGIAVIFIPHTTAGVTINENADPDVTFDLKNIFNNLIPEKNNYRHIEGNSQAHALSTLTSPSLTVIIENGKIMLGTWQNIYFMEYDGPRNRKAYIQIINK
ncbi:MAG: secondary thiamine-phosphate synthase enzyme YjbQ [Candidatus Mucispirillum faecigallinarum]|uniref:Secondary thiamine-phosphate synthase enzyme YjbQ n=1 Tax=Candidatus Mucispirillum faecigallinarum TaxID=2838699 RepID=A0A9D2KBT1_9BACT|nr:secondary thiamine-phosphate synthase enzyme YjbQ [Mucispirillum sp.]MDY5051967.1 secondary thiamine-phosphate synthase enzyme YjbQ [Candidatus Mucispirillum faecigallinarum]HIZ88388.1 secondary thiamine-phosphate synthase enzyme YjbQ [Candidatus Mucispirillum faecigallinarum]